MTRTAPECRDARRGGFAVQSRFELHDFVAFCERKSEFFSAVVQVASSSDEGAAQDESGVSVAMCITEDDTPLSIPDEETPPSGNAGTGFWSILFQLLKHLAGKH